LVENGVAAWMAGIKFEDGRPKWAAEGGTEDADGAK